MLWLISSRSPAFMRAANNITMSLGSRDVLISPTVTNPSATDIVTMERAASAINESVRRAGFFSSLAGAFVDGLLRSQTGAFAIPSRDGAGNVVWFEFINPLLPRPYYGFDPVSGFILTMPTIKEKWVKGIWYYASPETVPYVNDDYIQSVYGAYGSGAWLDGEPPAERILQDVTADATLADYMRRVINGTDLSQIITIANADVDKITEWRDGVQAIMERRARGEVIPVADMPKRLLLAKNSSLSQEDIRVAVHDLRILPKDFDLDQAMNRTAHSIAQGLGISPRWTAVQRAEERSGNATQSALINSDEPGMSMIESAFTALLARFLLPGASAMLRLQSASTPENYARLSADEIAVRNAVNMANLQVDKPIIDDYLLRNGVLAPSDVGNMSYSLSADAGYFTKAIVPRQGPAVLAFHRRPQISVASKELTVGEEFERCSVEATARYQAWIEEQMPTVLDGNRMNVPELRSDVDSIARTIGEEVVQCGRRYAASRNDAILVYLDHLRYGLYNRWGSPDLQTDRYPKPKPDENLYAALRAYLNDILIGRAGVEDLKRTARGFAFDILRYFAAASALAYIAAGTRHDGPVTWVLDELAKHCSECPKYAGTYSSYRAMLRTTGGKVPRDIRLQCAGGCRCRLLTLQG